ncbi:MAG: helicase-exonuclease AddAB subunit AddA [Firmicutes bacterium]|nr:helicase-exonuclease AddAB subunit AddA [Bacillota bacterium]
MTEFNYTPEQRAAIFERGSDLLVSAGAGSGKTSVLVQRIIERVRQGGSVDRILALTFTKSAAADMRARIDAALNEASLAAPDDLHLARQAALVGQARIGTIHSFCLELLRARHYRVGLSPTFRVAGEGELSSLLEQVLNDLFEEGYAAPDGRLQRLADAYGGSRDDSELALLVRRLHDYSMSRPHPEEWLRWAAGCGTADALNDQNFAPYLERALAGDLRAVIQRLKASVQLSGLPMTYGRQCQTAAEMLEEIAAVPGLSQKLTALSALELPRLNNPKKSAVGDMDENGEYVNFYDDDNIQRFKERRKAALKSLNEKLKGKYCARSIARLEEDIAATRPLLQDLAELVIAYGQRLEREKRRRNWVDFADLEQLTLGLLEDEEEVAALRRSFDEVLVDEYQDINQVQHAIVSRLADAGCLFSVGDVKQSIYRFRSAEPQLFLEKYRLFGEGVGGSRIDLNRNFRSTRRVVEGINHLFRRLMLAPAMELDYDEAAELKAGSPEAGPLPEFHLVDLDLSGGDAPGGLLAEGRLIARRILELRAEEPDLEYSQIAVLLRSSRNREEIIAAALAEAGIPAVATGGSAFAESPEVELALDLLRLIDNPRQDIPLAAVLRSPLFGVSHDQLVEIRLLDKKADLWQTLQLAASSDLSCSGRVRSFLAQLTAWRRLAAECGVDQLLLQVYNDTSIMGLVGAMEGGERRQANLDQLHARAHQYQEQSAAGLFRFLCRMDDDRRLYSDADATLPPREGADAVQIMSIHKSKGLEFPVVFVAGLAARFNTRDEKPDVIWQSDLGLAGRRVLRDQHLKFNTLSHLAVARRQHEQSLAEEMRILYVALTRAKRRLILTASSRDLGRQAAAWPERLDGEGRMQQYALTAAICPLDWLAPALLSDGGAVCLRDLASGPLPAIGDASWQCFVHPLSELALPTDAEEKQAEEAPVDEGLLEQVRQRFAWSYPHAHRCAYPAKWSVSELNRLGLVEEERSEVRLLTNGEEEQAAGGPAANVRGSAIHRMLEVMDLAQSGREEIAAQIESLTAEGTLAPEEAAAVDGPALARFFRSDLGARLARAEKVRRESPFTLSRPLDDDDSVLIQGVIDAAFWDEDGWVLLDYKTGGRGKNDEQLVAQYGEQLSCYRQAIETLWGSPVKESWLCMLDLGRNIRL